MLLPMDLNKSEHKKLAQADKGSKIMGIDYFRIDGRGQESVNDSEQSPEKLKEMDGDSQYKEDNLSKGMMDDSYRKHEQSADALYGTTLDYGLPKAHNATSSPARLGVI